MRSRTSGASGSGAIYATTPQIANLFAAPTNNLDTGGFGVFTQDNRVRGGGYVTQFAPSITDYLGFQFTLGPQGSIWALRWSFAVAPDAARFDFLIASVTEPDPNRGGFSDAGSLLRAPELNYLTWGGTEDAYSPAFADSQSNGQLAIRVMGADHAPLTHLGLPHDPMTGFNEIDGGSGVYRIRLRVVGKNAASSNYKVYLTALAMIRLDDDGIM